ncbi:hypothetical protein ABT120_42435 [Nonomuraea angiospora]|uniref:hypothetical protein n=1 Tax=Nonomuraea angiospora TaxID=46172 RepID=UPI00332406AE
MLRALSGKALAVLASLALILTLHSPRFPAATARDTAASVGLQCRDLSCRYYFSRAQTAKIKTTLDAREWTAQAGAQLICSRIPHKVVAAFCPLAFAYLYDSARSRLVNAYKRGGCLVLRARVSWRRSITFASVPPTHSRCV